MDLEARFSKLPKFAQEEIVGLRRTIETLRRSLKEQQQSEPSRVRWGRMFNDDMPKGFLSDTEHIHFRLSDLPLIEVRAGLVKDNGLYINGDDRLYLTFEASNACTIRVKP